MIMWTNDPVVAYCMQISMGSESNGEIIGMHLTGYFITISVFFVYIEKSWAVIKLPFIVKTIKADQLWDRVLN